MGNSRRVHYAGALAALVFLAQPAVAKPAPQPPEPTEHPDWAVVSRQAVDRLKERLADPASAQIVWTRGFTWGFWKPIFSGRKFGWVACGTMNAKNLMGGYTGPEGFLVLIESSGTMTAVADLEFPSSCNQGPATPVQPELYGQEAPQAFSVADEIRKLAKLRDDGLITAAEFDAGKAKLLGN